MTIRLLAAYSIYPANAIITLDSATEAGLIATGQASANLAGGVTWSAPVVPAYHGGDPDVVYATAGQVAALKSGGKPLPPGTNVIDPATGDYLGTIDGDGDISAAPGGGSVQNSLTPGSTTAAPSVDAVVGGLAGKADYFAPVVENSDFILTATRHGGRSTTVTAQAIGTFNTGHGLAIGDSGIIVQEGAGTCRLVSGTATVSLSPAVETASTAGLGTWMQWRCVGANEVRVMARGVKRRTGLINPRSFICTPIQPSNTSIHSTGQNWNISGTAAARTVSAGSLLTELVRVGFVSAAAINSPAGFSSQGSGAVVFNTLSHSYETVFAGTDGLSGTRGQYGFAQGALNGALEPDSSSYAARFFIGHRSTDTQFQIFSSFYVSGTTITPVSSGSGFPTNTSDVYRVRLDFFPAGPRRVEWSIENMTTGAFASGVYTDAATLPDPAAAFPMYYNTLRNSAANAAGVSMDFIGIGGGSFT